MDLVPNHEIGRHYVCKIGLRLALINAYADTFKQ